MHPGAWIAWALCGGLVAISTTNPFFLIPIFASAWIVYAAHRREGPMARSFRTFALFGLVTIATRTALVLLGPVTRGSVIAALLEGTRLAVLLTIFGTFNSVADPYGVLRLSPRRFHEPALAAALALSITPRTIAAAGRVREAQRLRGIEVRRWRSLPALAVPVLESGMEEAVTLAETMDARGHGYGPRSRYRRDDWNPISLVTIAAAFAAAVVFVGRLVMHDSSLTMSTFPLTWPSADALGVAAALLLAVPALFRARG
jgi:energy-coupling factor transport system permease protein